MGATTIKRDVNKEAQRLLKIVRKSSRPWYCTVLQNPDGQILGVSIDRNAIGRLYERLAANGIDYSVAECKDFEITI